MFFWNKTRNGKTTSLPGTYSDSSIEELKIATKGQPLERYMNPRVRVPQLVSADTGKHSEKPSEIMRLIESKFYLKKMRALEVFARARTSPYFDLYGDELAPRFQPAQNK